MTYQKSTKEGLKPCAGKVMNFTVGGKPVKFFYQTDDKCLAHYASGQIVAPHETLNSIRIAHMMAYGHASQLNDRAACQIALEKIIKKHGEDRFFSVINSAPVVNHD